MSWDGGYVSQIDYYRGYFGDLNPLTMKLAMLVHGYHSPPVDRPLRYLELGFGQGISLNIHAAACKGEFWGNDFIPSHASSAKTMADISDANIFVFEDSFATLAAREDLPEFDVIALHGVWSWVSDENRGFILKIIKSKLALGGIVYISYNTSQGCMPILPVRDLMMLHMNSVSPKSNDMASKIKDASAFMQQLMNAGAAYFSKNPPAAKRFGEMAESTNFEYLAHEYFNADWAIMSFSDVAACLANLGLTFAGGAGIRNFFAASLLSSNIKSQLASIKDPFLREDVHDFCVTQMFRADLWLNGGRRLSPLQKMDALADMRFTLITMPSSEETLELVTDTGKLTLDKNMASSMLAVLADNNFEPKSIRSLLGYPSLKHLNLPQACDLMLSLCGVCVRPAQDDETIALVKPRTDKLNTFLINQSRCGDYSLFLASPVTGGGISVSRFHQLSLLALREGLSTVEEVVNFIWQLLSSQGQFVVAPDGVPCKGKQENVNVLTSFVTNFFESYLPLLRALKIS